MESRVGRLIERVADRIALDRMSTDAIDLNALASSLGAVKVVYRFVRVHGFTEWTRWGPIIVTSMARTDGRRRTTLAHECAHLLFDPVVSPAGLQRWGQENVENFRRRSEELLGDDLQSIVAFAVSHGVENLCDRLSFELLIPQRRALDFANSRIGLDRLCDIATASRTSLAVTVRALNRFDAAMTLVRITKSADGTWIVASVTSSDSYWRPGQSLSIRTCENIDSLNPDAEHSQLLPIQFGGCGQWLEVDIRRGRRDGLLLISAGTSVTSKSALAPSGHFDAT